jgi:hypothetical protein
MPDVAFGGAFLVGRVESFCARPNPADDFASSQWLRLRQRVRTSNDIWHGRKSFTNWDCIAFEEGPTCYGNTTPEDSRVPVKASS